MWRINVAPCLSPCSLFFYFFCRICLFVIPYPLPSYSYKILNPGPVGKEKDPQKAAQIILDAAALDAELYRLGHTKACPPKILYFGFMIFVFLWRYKQTEVCLLRRYHTLNCVLWFYFLKFCAKPSMWMLYVIWKKRDNLKLKPGLTEIFWYFVLNTNFCVFSFPF